MINEELKARYARAAVTLNFDKLEELAEEYGISGACEPLDAEVEKLANGYGELIRDEVRKLCYSFVNKYLSPDAEITEPTDADRLYKSILDASEFVDVRIVLPNNVTLYKQKRGIFEIDANEYTATELYKAIGYTFGAMSGTRFKLSNFEVLVLLYAFYK